MRIKSKQTDGINGIKKNLQLLAKAGSRSLPTLLLALTRDPGDPGSLALTKYSFICLS